MVRQWLKAFTDLLFPRTCFSCNKKINSSILCRECFEKIIFINPPICSLKNKEKGKYLSFDSLVSITLYREPIVSLLHLYKYRHYAFLKDFFSALMIEHLDRWGFTLDHFDCLTAVPAHFLRRRDREYSQTGLLAENLAKKTGITLKSDLLSCHRAFPSQTGVKMSQRRQNVKGVFSINRSPKDLNILLLDDVFTTGSTLSECSAVLKKHGAAGVTALTLAKAL